MDYKNAVNIHIPYTHGQEWAPSLSELLALWGGGDVRVCCSSAPHTLKAVFLLSSLNRFLQRRISFLYWTTAVVLTQKAVPHHVIRVPYY